MALKISRGWLRSIYKSPYLVYPAGILALVLTYSLLFLAIRGISISRLERWTSLLQYISFS
jgi:hypothetical protein